MAKRTRSPKSRKPAPRAAAASKTAYDTTRFLVGHARNTAGAEPVVYVFDRSLPRYATVQVGNRTRYGIAFSPLAPPQTGVAYTAKRAGGQEWYAGTIEVTGASIGGSYTSHRGSRMVGAPAEGVPVLKGGSVALGELFDQYMRSRGVRLRK